MLTPAPLPLSARELQAAGILTLREEVLLRDPLLGRSYPVTQPPPLTSEQATTWQRIVTAGMGKPGGATFLLHGVTGSGKTEIYLRAIDAVIRRGQQAIVLVPEIALTPQTVARFAGRFPGRVTVIHSELSIGERYDVWRGIRAGRYDIVIGPRSALFAPVPALGLIVIDEEHEGTYKHDTEVWGGASVFYDARTVARHMVATQGCLLIAGSATPSLESYFAAQQGDMILLEMAQRVMGHREDGATFYAELPPVEVVDMRQELRAGNRSIFSRSLSSQLIGTLEGREQAILFLNRRGTNTFILCRDCGYVAECKSLRRAAHLSHGRDRQHGATCLPSLQPGLPRAGGLPGLQKQANSLLRRRHRTHRRGRQGDRPDGARFALGCRHDRAQGQPRAAHGDLCRP